MLFICVILSTESTWWLTLIMFPSIPNSILHVNSFEYLWDMLFIYINVSSLRCSKLQLRHHWQQSSKHHNPIFQHGALTELCNQCPSSEHREMLLLVFLLLLFFVLVLKRWADLQQALGAKHSFQLVITPLFFFNLNITFDNCPSTHFLI